MASTYSTLKIQLMGTGENSGTWGTVTNTNLGTAIEEAIVGSADVTFASADVTLTLTDTNASQTARNLRLNLTGTAGGAARNLIVPAIEKIYIVNNGLANDVTVKNSTGTGIVVPAGKTMYVYNNGTNVVDAITHLTSLTAGSLSLSTPLAVASGGTGSNTGTFSGANITSLNASNISSGVLAVAQGGTGSATATFSGANISSINASNISSGTLAVARGGTGLSSVGTSGNVLTSTGSVWESQALPSGFIAGMIMMWSGTIATIPSGWALCNGSNGTPDLRDRFIVGASVDNAGASNTTITGANTKSGGSKDAIAVSHTHTATSTVTDPGHIHDVPNYNGYSNGDRICGVANGTNLYLDPTASATTGITVSTTIASAGSSGTNANLPPYFALAFIMKL